MESIQCRAVGDRSAVRQRHRPHVCRPESDGGRVLQVARGGGARDRWGGQRRRFPGGAQGRGNPNRFRFSWQESRHAATRQHAGCGVAILDARERPQVPGKGGDVQVIPISNPDQLTLFLKGQIDAAWAPEPWAARLVHEGGGRIFLDERDLWPDHQFVITNIIVSPKFLKEHPDVVKNFLRTHVELTEWINKNPAQAKQIMNQQLQKETGKALPAEVLDEAFSRMQVTYDPIHSSLLKSTQQAFDEGFLGRTQPDLSGLYDLKLLNEVLSEKKARPVQ